MTLAETSQLLGVIVSLIYVAIWNRNNAGAAGAATHQQLSASISIPWAELGRN